MSSARVNQDGTPARRPRACAACRHMKLKCDAEEKGTACSRCLKMGRACHIAAFTERRIRKTKTELEQELQSLKTSLRSANSSRRLQPRIDIADAGTLTPTRAYLASVLQPQQSPEVSPIAGIQPDALSERAVLGTLPRKIGDLHLDARKVDACVFEFFQFYAYNVEGLFVGLEDPNALYDYSPVLFWIIVYVGSRKYARDPTIIERIIHPLQTLFQQSLFDPENAIPSIQAALLLCLWPFPVDTQAKLRTHVISGAAMMLAMQRGLHLSSKAQDFVLVPLTLSGSEQRLRKALWMHCQIVFQGNSVHDGLLPMMETPHENADYTLLSDYSFLVYQHQLHTLFMRSYRILLNAEQPTQEIISQAKQTLEADAVRQSDAIYANPLNTFLYDSALLLLDVFYFLCPPSDSRDKGIRQAFDTAVAVLNGAIKLDQQSEFASRGNHSHHRVCSLAAVVILRVSKSHLAMMYSEVVELAEPLYFEAIRLTKKASVRLNDLSGRNASILTQLWSSMRIFQFKNGSVDGLRLLLRGRLCMSLVMDAHWWWRAEFGGKSNPYLESDSAEPRQTANATPANELDLDLDALDPALLPSFLHDAASSWNFDEMCDFGLEWY